MILRGDNLIKEYGPKKVVKGVSLEVKKGEIVGLLRPRCPQNLFYRYHSPPTANPNLLTQPRRINPE